MGDASAAVKVGIGSSVVLGRLNMLFESVESLRSLARIQPFWTNVSFPSGRTSLMVACRSTSGVADRTQRYTAPLPMTVVFAVSGAETYETAVLDGLCCHLQSHWDAFPHNPPVPVLGPKSVSGRAFAFAVNQLIPPVVGALLLSTPDGPKYHVRAVVPGMGKDEKLCSNPGYGSPGFAV
jgi:hypothetical protein